MTVLEAPVLPVWAPTLYPPRSWFEPPTAEMMAQVPPTSDSPIIEFDGQAWGRLAAEDAVYLNVVGIAVHPDMDPAAYGSAMSKTKRLADGTRLQCAVISLATGHAPADISDPEQIRAWYASGGPANQAADDATAAMFHVRYHCIPGSGIWWTGCAAPHRSEFDAIVAASSAPSGDWVRLMGQPYRTLLGACMVASQGFRASITVPRVAAAVLTFLQNDRLVTYGRAERIAAGVGSLDKPVIELARLTAALTGDRYVSWGSGEGSTMFGTILHIAVKPEDSVTASNGDTLTGDPLDPAVHVVSYAADELGMYQATQESMVVRSSALRPWDDASFMRTMSAVGDISVRSSEPIVSAEIVTNSLRGEDEVTFELNGNTVTGRYLYDLGYPSTVGPIAAVDVDGIWFYVPFADLTPTGGHFENVELRAGEMADLAEAGLLTIRNTAALTWVNLKAAGLI